MPALSFVCGCSNTGLQSQTGNLHCGVLHFSGIIKSNFYSRKQYLSLCNIVLRVNNASLLGIEQVEKPTISEGSGKF